MKKYLSFLLILATVLMLLVTGCGGSNKSNTPEALSGDHDKTTSLGTLETTIESDFFLSRGEKKYLIGYNHLNSVGVRSNSNDADYLLYTTTQNYSNLKENRIISMKDVPVPIIQENDKIYTRNRKIEIVPVKFIGYGPLVIVDNFFEIRVEESKQILNPVAKFSELSITAMDENRKTIPKNLASEGVADLKYNQELTVSYKEKDSKKWHAYRSYAICSYYETNGTSVQLPSNTAGEYTIYDPTKLTAGYYAIYTGKTIQSIFVVQ